ncbi:MAG: eukaryotic-like serine/threonine-protein kinase [Acidobacteriota bacterium]|jgi:serine/threonine protein kinase/tetratricopeptide (TPR) repeat protein|nr:eukaryotic-like serine/threonine-protein kinase [Acidobacteriota bacterium]
METQRERLGQYVILGPLGAGGMGEVFSARDPVLGRKVAIKVLAVRLSGDRDTLTRFTQEARSASALNHPNIVTIHEVGMDEGAPYIVMECIEGRDLRSMLAAGPLPNRKTLEIASQIADGLAAAHEQGIIHRDLKPENIMYTKDGYVKILDFGLAKVVRATPGDEEDTLELDLPGTNPGTILGTVGYMSPEQARGKTLDVRSDQFALGAILYELATGRPAFDRDTAIDTLSAILHDDPEPIGRYNAKIPQPFCWIVDRLLSKEPDERYASTRDLAKELRTLRERMATESSDFAIPRPPMFASKRSRLIAVGAAVLIAASGAVWLERDRLPLSITSSQNTAKKYLAVMRFKDLTGDPSGQLVIDGFAETLTARLAHLPSVQVMHSEKPENSANPDRLQIARELGANVILSGSILRNGDRLRIVYNVFDTSSKVESGDTIDGSFSDLFGAQDKLADSVAAALHLGRGNVEGARVQVPSDAASQRKYLEALGSMRRYDDVASVDNAIRILQSLQGENSASIVAALGRAYLYKYRITHERTWADRAGEACERAASLDPQNPDVHFTLGELRRLTGHHAEAIDAYKRALAQNPNNADAVLGLAETYSGMGKIKEAENEYRRAIALQPNYWGGYHKLGSLYFYHQHPEQSVAMFEKVRQLMPDNPLGYSYLGGAYQQMGDYTKALSYFEESMRLKPTPGAWSNIGTCHFAAGEFAAAAQAYEKSCELMPAKFIYRMNLGDALWFQPGARQQAIGAYKKAIELTRADLRVNPDDATARAAMAVCLAKVGDARGAREAIDAALKVDATNSLYLYNAAVVANVSGDRAATVKYLRSAIDNGRNAAELQRDPEFANLAKTDIFTPIPQQSSAR